MIAVDELVHNKGAKVLENPNPCKDLKISEILHDLKDTEFSLGIEEVEARKAILALYEKDLNDSASSMENAELEAIQIATSRLKINSTFSLIVEKASLRKQLDQVINNDTNQKEKQLLQYLLYLLMRYGKFIHQIGSNSLDHDLVVDKEHSHQVMESIDNVVRDFEVLST
nr:uncharacterized protein LOC112697978 isoform X2 [Arachis hypogaea]XP_025660592.1 uncharacterized protein LOC112756286 isoform X2 [Arachis hypogaea]